MTEAALFKQLNTVYGKTPGSKRDFYEYGRNAGSNGTGGGRVYGGEGRRPRAVSFSTMVTQRSVDGSTSPKLGQIGGCEDARDDEAEVTLQKGVRPVAFARRKRRIKRLTEEEKRHLYAFREDLRPSDSIWGSERGGDSWTHSHDPFLEQRSHSDEQ